MITPKQKKAYMAKWGERGASCPYCKCRKWSGSGYEKNGNMITSVLECHDCHTRWSEIFELIDIVEISPPQSLETRLVHVIERILSYAHGAPTISGYKTIIDMAEQGLAIHEAESKKTPESGSPGI